MPGVSRLAPVPGGVNRLFRRGSGDGVRIETEENTVFADLYFVVKQDVNIREVSRNVQKQVARAIQEMVGMEIGHVNIHIEDIDYEEVQRGLTQYEIPHQGARPGPASTLRS